MENKRKTAESVRERSPLGGREAPTHEESRTGADEVRIQLMAEHLAKAGVLFRDVFLTGGGILRCRHGRFRFTLEGRAPIVISAAETIVVYPNQRVTIEALDRRNLLVYVICEGRGVSSYFDRLGFFNGIHGPTGTQIDLFRDVKRRFEGVESIDQSQLMTWLSYALVTYAHELRVGDNILVGDAIRQIRANLTNRIVRLTPLYEQLRVGHTTLNQAFQRAGIGVTPAEFVRQEQFNLVAQLLRTTRKPIAEIAAETGFISVTHFANFVKRRSGISAREIRSGRKNVKFRREV